MTRQGVATNAVTYSTWICACEKGRQPEQALDFFEMLKQHGVVPDVVSYSALISACEKGNQPWRAMELFETMTRHKSNCYS